MTPPSRCRADAAGCVKSVAKRLTNAKRPHDTDHRPPTTDHRPPTTDHRPPTTDHRPPTTDHRPPTDPCCELDEIKLNILRLLALGLERKQIAYKLGLHYNNISYHLKEARKTLKARSDVQAVVVAIKNGLISP